MTQSFAKFYRNRVCFNALYYKRFFLTLNLLETIVAWHTSVIALILFNYNALYLKKENLGEDYGHQK